MGLVSSRAGCGSDGLRHAPTRLSVRQRRSDLLSSRRELLLGRGTSVAEIDVVQPSIGTRWTCA